MMDLMNAPRTERQLVAITRAHHAALKAESQRRKEKNLPAEKMQAVIDEIVDAGLLRVTQRTKKNRKNS